MSISEVDKCYLCELIGDFDEFKDIKEKFDVQHECWKQQQNQDSQKVYLQFAHTNLISTLHIQTSFQCL